MKPSILNAAPLLAALLAFAAPARAELKLCNTTPSRIGVAVGYKDAKDWATEGWWNVASQTCETVLKGSLPSRYLYVYAVDYDRGGEWAGTSVMCTDDKTFTIRGAGDCQKRGFRKNGFFEVDTGDSRDWTIRLSDPDTQGGKAK